MRCSMKCSRCVVCGAHMCIMTSHDAALRICGAHKFITKSRTWLIWTFVMSYNARCALLIGCSMKC